LAELVRLGKPITEAILTVLKYVGEATGAEPSQEEFANALKSYFILNEIGNQVKFLRKKKILSQPPETSSGLPFWTLNLMKGPPRNSLVRVGLFYPHIKDAISAARRFVKDSSGQEPSETEIALSLKSTFILSEIKNQIEWQRNDPPKNV
jgi:SOS-response transcriptional repressor LexA